jgi:hypothetical protein
LRPRKSTKKRKDKSAASFVRDFARSILKDRRGGEMGLAELSKELGSLMNGPDFKLRTDYVLTDLSKHDSGFEIVLNGNQKIVKLTKTPKRS